MIWFVLFALQPPKQKENRTILNLNKRPSSLVCSICFNDFLLNFGKYLRNMYKRLNFAF